MISDLAFDMKLKILKSKLSRKKAKRLASINNGNYRSRLRLEKLERELSRLRGKSQDANLSPSGYSGNLTKIERRIRIVERELEASKIRLGLSEDLEIVHASRTTSSLRTKAYIYDSASKFVNPTSEYLTQEMLESVFERDFAKQKFVVEKTTGELLTKVNELLSIYSDRNVGRNKYQQTAGTYQKESESIKKGLRKLKAQFQARDAELYERTTATFSRLLANNYHELPDNFVKEPSLILQIIECMLAAESDSSIRVTKANFAKIQDYFIADLLKLLTGYVDKITVSEGSKVYILTQLLVASLLFKRPVSIAEIAHFPDISRTYSHVARAINQSK